MSIDGLATDWEGRDVQVRVKASDSVEGGGGEEKEVEAKTIGTGCLGKVIRCMCCVGVPTGTVQDRKGWTD